MATSPPDDEKTSAVNPLQKEKEASGKAACCSPSSNVHAGETDKARNDADKPVSPASSDIEGMSGELRLDDDDDTARAETEPEQAPQTDLEKQISRASSEGPLFCVLSKRTKMFIVVMSALGGIISPLSSSIYFPSLVTLSHDFNVSMSAINLTVTIYLVMQGLSPMIVQDFADQAGFRPAFVLCYTIYVLANLGLALQNSYPALLVLRFIQAAGASGTIALRNGVIASIITPAERGSLVGFVSAGTIMAPAFAPTIGGLLADNLGWRSIFWFLVIVCGVYTVPYTLIVPETHREIVGNCSIPPLKWYNRPVHEMLRPVKVENLDEKTREALNALPVKKISWPRPWRSLMHIFEKDIALCFSYQCLLYGVLYSTMTTIPSIFTPKYGLNELQIGLCFIPFGISMALAAILNGRLLDWNFRRVAKLHGLPADRKRGQELRRFPIEQARLGPTIPMSIIGSMFIIGYGWALEYTCPLAVILVLQFLLALFLTAGFQSITNLVVDCFQWKASQITAASNITRCLFGAGATAVIQPMLGAMGVGWSWTFMGLVCFAATPMLFIELRMGPKWREARHVRQDKKNVAEEARQKQSSSTEKS